ncbi:SDR family oxidoreductase [Magnetospira sp. QH-2]|uniref:SDR family oxidoreductase n=1 Tax=Magnetospira sp. (strain QH-2) TaxID=1288970 RepID=UPI0003E814EB|nr:SDR family oxidoreductase [Magnetospira sp. QH-2]CCQ72055.1 NAD-dependent epimerase [Magnetospira sp. QH-2]
MSKLFVFGLGYSAGVLAERLGGQGWQVTGTHRGDGEGLRFDRDHPLDEAALAALKEADHLLLSVPPDGAGDPVRDLHGAVIAACARLRWIGYLSTTGVYGDTGGAWVDEQAPLAPTTERSRYRVAAEQAWLELARAHDLPLQIFRLAGIYGPGRSELDRVRAGRAKRIDLPGRRFGRIHAEDIATVLEASMARPNPGRVYNVSDNLPVEPRRVTERACALLGVAPPPLVPFDQAFQTMSPMQRTFWRDDRLISNARLHEELGVTLAYPTYEQGLQAIHETEKDHG